VSNANRITPRVTVHASVRPPLAASAVAASAPHASTTACACDSYLPHPSARCIHPIVSAHAVTPRAVADLAPNARPNSPHVANAHAHATSHPAPPRVRVVAPSIDRTAARIAVSNDIDRFRSIPRPDSALALALALALVVVVAVVSAVSRVPETRLAVPDTDRARIAPSHRRADATKPHTRPVEARRGAPPPRASRRARPRNNQSIHRAIRGHTHENAPVSVFFNFRGILIP
jgi:hypothetical protein